MIELGKADARRFLARYHLEQTDVPGVFKRLGSVQVDPLNPVGRNHDLVLQARVPGYRVGDWEKVAYGDRLVYDAWDKQACLVPVADWPTRRLYHDYFRPRWQERVLTPHADAVRDTLAELRVRGPMSSLEFENQQRVESWAGSWYGPRLVKQTLRALWDTGQVVTHHRVKGRHVYDLPERVLPAEVVNAPTPPREAALRTLILRRHQSAGLLRENADAALWSLPAPSAERKVLIAQLVEEGQLLPVQLEGCRGRYHMLSMAREHLAATPPEPRMSFLAPLDSLLWDRKAVEEIFGFKYLWEVYKPEHLRAWGYYVLPVFYGERFVGRVDSRLAGGVWQVLNWWWEPDVEVDAETLRALSEAVRRFVGYLGAIEIELSPDLDRHVRTALVEVSA